MSESEEFLNLSTKKDWAITCTIPSFKKVRFQTKNKMYKSYSHEEQELILKQAIYDAYRAYGHTADLSLKFERHADGRLHVHFTIFYMTEYNLYEMAKKYCFFVGFKAKNPEAVRQNFYYVEKLSDGWERYIRKNQQVDDLDADLLLLTKPEANNLIVEF